MAHGSPFLAVPLPLRAALDQLDQGVSIFDAELRLQAWNRRFLDMLGLPQALGAAGTPFAELVRDLAGRGELGPGAVEVIVAQRVKAARECRTSFYAERTTRHGRVLAIKTSPLPEGGLVSVYSDIHGRSRAEALTPARSDELEARVNRRTLEVRENEARLRLICDAMPAAIAYLDDRLIVRFGNRFLARLFARPVESIAGLQLRELFGERLPDDLAGHVEQALRGERVSFEYSYPAVDGHEVITRNFLVPELAPGGGVRGLFVLSVDVTEEKRAQRAQQEAQKMSAIGQLAGGLAHDFNNLLTVVVSSLSSLKERVGSELVRDYVAPALRASSRGVGITRRLLAFARQQALEPLAIDVPALIAGTIQMLARSFPASTTITCCADAGGWPALADPAQLENALVNLALNARDAMPEGGQLRFATSYEHVAEGVVPGDYVRIRVIDSGTGIAPEVQARMLEPFFTTKPFGSGSGLGLPMVFGFARQSGGDLRIDSELGKGTSVSLLLPRAPADAPRALDVADAPGPAIANHGELVLLVEDHDDVRQAVRRQLLELGYQVLEARDGDDARSLLAAVPGVSILVSDVVMPGGQDGGLGLIDHARQQLPGLRTLLISGFANFSAAGYDWFDEKLVLHKPFDREQLARAIDRAKP